MNQTQPSGSPQLGVERSETHSPPGREGLRGKGAPSQRPCRTLDSARGPCAAGQPPFRNVVCAQRPPGAAWTQHLPDTDRQVLSTSLQTESRQLTSCSQDSNPVPVASLPVHSTPPTEGPMGPASSQRPSHTQAPT